MDGDQIWYTTRYAGCSRYEGYSIRRKGNKVSGRGNHMIFNHTMPVSSQGHFGGLFIIYLISFVFIKILEADKH